MKSIKESIVESLDGGDTALFPFMPYILQDLWEIGSLAEPFIHLIEKHVPVSRQLKILDLGCGKGFVSIHLAGRFKCHCHGIDAMPEFIAEARKKAAEYGIDDLCRFEFGDIRDLGFKKKGYDLILLGSIGPVLGSHFDTLTGLSGFITGRGKIIWDDGYIDDRSDFDHPLVARRSDLLEQIHQAGMRLVDETIIDPGEIETSNQEIFRRITQRCRELMDQHPDQAELFRNYIHRQAEENQVLESKVVCSTMMIEKQRKTELRKRTEMGTSRWLKEKSGHGTKSLI